MGPLMTFPLASMLRKLTICHCSGCMFKISKLIHQFLIGTYCLILDLHVSIFLWISVLLVDSRGIARFGGTSYLHVLPVFSNLLPIFDLFFFIVNLFVGECWVTF